MKNKLNHRRQRQQRWKYEREMEMENKQICKKRRGEGKLKKKS